LATAYLVDAKEQYIRYGSPVLVEKVEEKLAALHPEKRRSPTGLKVRQIIAKSS
jgi:hypothetical protein